MKPENAIEVQDVRKNFKIYYDKGHMLRERVISFYRNKYELSLIHILPDRLLYGRFSAFY